MVYRIDMQNFLVHMIDYFTKDEIEHCQYLIISAAVSNSGKVSNMAKANELYPTPEVVTTYASCHDKNIMEKMYWEELEPDEDDKKIMRRGGGYWLYNKIYDCIINPFLKHFDVVIICDRTENDYIDVFCKFLKKKFEVDVIDLNELFRTGHVGPIRIDRKKIEDNAVNIRRAAARDEIEALASTREGKKSLIAKMNKTEKIKHIKEYGIKLNRSDIKHLDEILLEAWCAEDGDSDDDD